MDWNEYNKDHDIANERARQSHRVFLFLFPAGTNDLTRDLLTEIAIPKTLRMPDVITYKYKSFIKHPDKKLTHFYIEAQCHDVPNDFNS